jgi:quercetin dioxygenase-like cupin family protein
VALVELEPDAHVPSHAHPNEQVGVLLRGEMDWTIGGEQRVLRYPGEGWRILGGVEHEVRAGPEGAVVVECFSPSRDDWIGLQPSNVAPRWP